MLLTHPIYEHHLDLIKAALQNTDYEPPFDSIHSMQKKPFIELFIKKGSYVSKYLHEVPLEGNPESAFKRNLNNPDYQFSIRGLFGKSISLWEGDLEDASTKEITVVAMALGIAIYAFADLIGYMMRANAYNYGVVKKKAYSLFKKADEEFKEDPQYRLISNPKFKFVLFASFDSLSNASGHELFTEFVEFNKKAEFKNFTYVLRTKETFKGHFTSGFLKEKIGDVSKVVKCFIAGGANAEDALSSTVIDAGIPKEKIEIC